MSSSKFAQKLMEKRKPSTHVEDRRPTQIFEDDPTTSDYVDRYVNAISLSEHFRRKWRQQKADDWIKSHERSGR